MTNLTELELNGIIPGNYYIDIINASVKLPNLKRLSLPFWKEFLDSFVYE